VRYREDAKRRIDKHLAPFFGNKRLSSITGERHSCVHREADGRHVPRSPTRRVRHRNGPWQEVPEVRRPVSAAEINRELTVLKRMFSLAIEAGKLHHKPHFAMLREDNVRVGFFERQQYEAVLAHLPAGMRPAVTFAYVTGWRINSEVLPLQWRQVDPRVGEVRLDPGTTKNREGSGHKTRSVFDRYNVVSAGDLREAAKRLDAVAGTISGTIEQNRRSGPKV
jgi:integrase